MWRTKTSLPEGQARCQPCRRANWQHGTLLGYDHRGCRCAECRAAKAASQREWAARFRAEHGFHYRGLFDKCRKPYEYDETLRRRDAKRRALRMGAWVESFTHAEVYARDGWVCGICSRPVDRNLQYPDPRSASLDHIVPLSHGGEHSRVNTRLAHLRCNIVRGTAAA